VKEDALVQAATNRWHQVAYKCSCIAIPAGMTDPHDHLGLAKSTRAQYVANAHIHLHVMCNSYTNVFIIWTIAQWTLRKIRCNLI